MSEINRRDINRCTCHCGGDMFYRHLHAASCPVSVDGEKAPTTENAALRAEIERLTRERDEWKERAGKPIVSDAVFNSLQQQLVASQARVKEFETTLPKVKHQSNLPCGHNAYWRTVYGTCMACRAEQAEQQRDRLRAALAAIAEQTTEAFIRSQAQQALGEGKTI